MKQFDHIVYLTDPALYLNKMSIGRREYAKAAGRKARLYSVAAADGRSTQEIIGSLKDNLKCGDPDLVIAYKTDAVSGMDQIGCPVATVFNEANDKRKTLDDLNGTQATHVFFHHAGDYAQWKSRLAGMEKSAHLIHHCSPDNPYSLNGGRKPIGLAGVLSDEIYPVRTRLARSSIVETRPHPGYRVQLVAEQYDSYQEWLSQYKVSVCCTSIYRYPLAKIAESLMAGCMVLVDKPECPFIGRFAEQHPECIQFIDEGVREMLVSDRLESQARAMRLIEEQAMSMVRRFDQEGHEGLEDRVNSAQQNFSLDVWADNFLSVF